MATPKSDADAPKTKKWDGNAERDLCLAIVMGNNPDSERIKVDWNNTHTIMTSFGYDFTKDAMSQRWSKTILKDFKSRHKGVESAGGAALVSPKKTPTKRKKADTEAVADEVPAGEAASASASTPPATPTAGATGKGRKRTPAKPKAAAGPPKPRGRKPKSAATVKAEEDADDEPAAVKEPEAAVKLEEAKQGLPSPSKKIKAESVDDVEMADEI